MNHGRFITLEGGEGAGKSTHARRLVERLSRVGVTAAQTREPGGAPGADQIRALLVTGGTGRWDAMTEALLHFAARRDHLTRTVWPALQAGTWMVSDRFADSSMAYQGYGLGLGRPTIETLYAVTVGDFRPDLTLILDLPAETGLQRAAGRGALAGAVAEDRYERMDLAFHRRLRDAFRDIAVREPARCRLLDADADIDVVAERIWRAVAGQFGLPA